MYNMSLLGGYLSPNEAERSMTNSIATPSASTMMSSISQPTTDERRSSSAPARHDSGIPSREPVTESPGSLLSIVYITAF